MSEEETILTQEDYLSSGVHSSQEVDNVSVNAVGVRPRGQRKRVCTIPHGISMTKQADKDKANIHNILKRYEKTGLLPQRVVSPIEGDVPQVESYHQALTILVEAQQAFDALPSNVRQKFENDPAQFLEFCNDAENKEEMKELGLIAPTVASQPVEVTVVGEPSTEGEEPASAPQEAGEAGTST